MRDAPRERAASVVVWFNCWMVLVALLGVGACADSGAASAEQRDAFIVEDASDVGLDASTTARVDAAADAADAGQDVGPLGPPYPIVLAHGMFGFEHLANIEYVPYWYGIVEALEQHGEVVFVTEVEPLNDSYTRGEQLAEQVEAIVRRSGYEKVNLIGHSQGGLDIRYVAHHRPDLVASAVGLAAPNHGTPVADIVLQLTDHARFPELVDALVRIIGKPLYDEAGDETSLFKPLRQFSEPGIEEYNRRITDDPGVYYASVAGRSDMHRGGLICNTNNAPDFIRKWDAFRDPVTPLFVVPEAIIDGGLENHPNDGMVRVDQAMWGDFLGCIPADHFDQVGQVLGTPPGGDNAFDHLEFFIDLADYLHSKGY